MNPSSALKGKKLAIIGSGYVGNRLASIAASQGCQVLCVSRSGRSPRPIQPEMASLIEHVKGNAMVPEGFKDVLKAADGVVFCIGTLIDTSITKRAGPGEEGTYEHMNRDCAIAVGNELEKLNDKNKKMVFISASKPPPFIPRYLSCKFEAEEHLRSLQNVRTTVLRPGFIFDSKERPISIPLKVIIDIHSKVFGQFLRILPEDLAVKKLLRNFDVDDSVALDAVAEASLLAAFNKRYDGKILFNNDMRLMSEILRKYAYKVDQI